MILFVLLLSFYNFVFLNGFYSSLLSHHFFSVSSFLFSFNFFLSWYIVFFLGFSLLKT
ncbi:hypothetical protein H8356DRAFT_1734352 [Neocallimastix lanati (nom. inval.)]|nr:hypothetical protein H8356DRAFT_1734352 [Neocallimastix sp. JGI-2020a]